MGFLLKTRLNSHEVNTPILFDLQNWLIVGLHAHSIIFYLVAVYTSMIQLFFFFNLFYTFNINSTVIFQTFSLSRTYGKDCKTAEMWSCYFSLFAFEPRYFLTIHFPSWWLIHE